MQHVSKTLNVSQAPSNASTQPRRTSSEIRAALVWRSMVELYGPAFLTAYGDSPSPLWLSAIEKLTETECARGLATLADEAREYPANLTQFAAACRGKGSGPRFLGTPTTPAQLRALEPPPEKRATPAQVDGWIARMRRRLAGPKETEPNS
jgi:hypothetical protein